MIFKLLYPKNERGFPAYLHWTACQLLLSTLLISHTHLLCNRAQRFYACKFNDFYPTTLFIPGFRIRIPLIWIRIHFFTFMRIHIELFTSMRIRILLIKVMQIFNHWPTDPTGLHLKPLRIHFRIRGPEFWLLFRSGSSFSLSRWSGSETLVHTRNMLVLLYTKYACVMYVHKD